MASSPFEFFRHHSKTIFLVMTTIMVVFILSSGLAGGDFFNDYLPRLFGGGNRKEAVATMDGSALTSADLIAARNGQRLANEFMFNARKRTNDNAFRRADEAIKAKQLPEEVAADLKPLVDAAMNRTPGDRNSQMALQIASFTLPELRKKIDAAKEPSAAKLVDSLLAAVRFASSEQAQGNYFQTITVGNNDRAAVEYVFLGRLADKLGVKIPDALVNAYIANETGGLSGEEGKGILQAIQAGTPGVTDDTIREAIRTELKVRTAMKVYETQMQRDGTLLTSATTPYDFYQYYKDARTPMGLALVEIPVEPFLALVTETPPADELEKLFKAQNTREADPASETPGFKLSRKVKAAYVGGSPNLDYYKQLPAKLEAASWVLAGASPTLFSAPAFMAQAAQPVLARELPMAEAMEGRKGSDRTRMLWSNQYMFTAPGSSAVAAIDSSVYNPFPIVSAAGLLAGTPSSLTPLVVDATYRGVVEAVEVRQRFKAGLPRVTALLPVGATSPLAALASVGGVLAATAPKEFDNSFYRGNYTEDLARRQRETLFLADFKVLDGKIADLGKPKPVAKKDDAAKDKDVPKAKDAPLQAVDALVAEFVKARPGTVSGISKEFRDKFTIAKDPALAALAAKVVPTQRPSSDWEIRFFPEAGVAGGRGSNNLFNAGWFPNDPNFTPTDAAPEYLTWAYAEQQPLAYREYKQAPDEVKAMVLYAWKLAKARDLAKAAAEGFKARAEEIGKANAANSEAMMRALRDEAGKGGYKVLNQGEPLSVTRLETTPPTQQSRGGYKLFQLQPELVEYPSPLMVRDLIELRAKPVGSAALTANAPKTRYVVGVSTRKDALDPSIFASTVFSRAGVKGLGGESLYATVAKPDIAYQNGRHIQRVRYAQAKLELDEEKLKARAKDGQQD